MSDVVSKHVCRTSYLSHAKFLRIAKASTWEKAKLDMVRLRMAINNV